MALLPANIKTRFPEFSCIDNDVIQDALDQAYRNINLACWASRADDGAAYLAAHLIYVFGGGSGGSSIAPIKSVKVGDVSTTYAIADETATTTYEATKYGQQFLTIKKSIFCCRCL